MNKRKTTLLQKVLDFNKPALKIIEEEIDYFIKNNDYEGFLIYLTKKVHVVRGKKYKIKYLLRRRKNIRDFSKKTMIYLSSLLDGDHHRLFIELFNSLFSNKIFKKKDYYPLRIQILKSIRRIIKSTFDAEYRTLKEIIIVFSKKNLFWDDFYNHVPIREFHAKKEVWLAINEIRDLLDVAEKLKTL